MFPLLALGIVEGILRLAGIGHPTTFLIRSQINAQDVLVDNPWFGLSYFPPALARSPSPIRIAVKKPPGTFRIFLFGESAALGDPRPAFGVGRYLETLLRERFPGTEFEVVCAAMTAINSHAILPMARECAKYQGDLWVVYMGNNEFAGPFGANTVFGPQAPPAWAVRFFLTLQSTRLGQLLVDAARSLHFTKPSATTWGGLKMFLDHQLPPDDPRHHRVYQNFQRNLDDLLDTANRARVPVLVSSVASNLKDCAPFGSFPPALSQNALADWQKFRALASTNAAQGNFLQAVQDYQQAAQIAPTSAEVQFQLGQCQFAMTNFSDARQSFARARDLDTLPFRTDTELNDRIAKTASNHAVAKVLFVDAEQALGQNSLGGIPGSEFFYEHVHLNPEGNYRLALAFAEQAIKCLPTEVLQRQKPAWPDASVCAERLALTDWNRYTIYEEILRRLSEPPFTGQLNHATQLEHLTHLLSQIRGGLRASAVQNARSIFETALKQRPQDHWLHHNYAEFLTNIGDLSGATDQMRAVCDLVPENYSGYFHLGRLLARQKKYQEAQGALQTAMRLRPDVSEVRMELGQILAAAGKLEAALEQYSMVQRNRGDDDPKLHLLEADVLARQHKRPEAIAQLREAIRLRPEYAEAHELLGMEFAMDAQYPQAQAEFERVIQLRPGYAEAHLNLGIALARQHQFDKALECFQTTLRLDPKNEQARGFLESIGQLQSQKGSP